LLVSPADSCDLPTDSVQLWNVATTQLIGSPLSDPAMGSANGPEYLAFSPDGTRLAVSLALGPIQVWNVGYLPPSRTAATLCAQVDGQNLAPQQWTEDAPGLPYQDICPPDPPSLALRRAPGVPPMYRHTTSAHRSELIKYGFLGCGCRSRTGYATSHFRINGIRKNLEKLSPDACTRAPKSLLCSY
jgi:hypothetical protein